MAASSDAPGFQRVTNVTFARHKYGPELLVDVAWIREMPTFIKSDRPYRLDFYDITLVASGGGRFCLDGEIHPLTPRTVLFTSPGQVRRWLVDDVDGCCLFFPEEFILEHFTDPLFLHRLRYFHTDGPFGLTLTSNQVARLRDRLQAMHDEMASLQPDSPHLLRAIAYEILVHLNRWYAARHGQRLDTGHNHAVSRFRQAVEAHYRHTHRVSDYARTLGITPGHLNALCRRHLGTSAGSVVHARVLSEARRMLLHTSRGVAQVAEALGFADPSYFSRVFKRATGMSPAAYRQRGLRAM